MKIKEAKQIKTSMKNRYCCDSHSWAFLLSG
jgi:hypothetical protein